MWCSTCQQDVPAIAHPTSGKSVCARCTRILQTSPAMQVRDDGIELDDEPMVATIGAAPPLAADDWQARRRTRELGRKLRIELGHTKQVSTADPVGACRRAASTGAFDHLRDLTASPIIEPAPYSQPRRSPAPRAEPGQAFAWLVTLVGMLALVGGLGSLGWIVVCGAMVWWNHALALTLAGQGLLILGLVMVVTRLWRNSRYASGKLQAVHAELAQLQRTADAIHAARAGGSPAFYAELVRGASPQMLLANLKGQIDQLATRLSGDI